MNFTGIDMLDRSLQATRLWLGEMEERSGADRACAWQALTVVLAALRDRLPASLAAHLGDRLPIPLRGAYYEGFDPSRGPEACPAPEDFLREIAAGLGPDCELEAADALAAVTCLLDRHLETGLVARIRSAMPRGLQMAWDGAEARMLSGVGAD